MLPAAATAVASAAVRRCQAPVLSWYSGAVLRPAQLGSSGLFSSMTASRPGMLREEGRDNVVRILKACSAQGLLGSA